MNAQLPPRHDLFRTRDLEEAREQVAHILGPHRLTASRQRGEFNVHYQHVSLGDTSVMYAEYGGDVIIDPGALESFYLVGMPQSGATRLHTDGQDVVSCPGHASVQSPIRPLRTTWLDGCRKITVKIGRGALEQHLTQLLDRPLHKPIEFALGMDIEHGPGLSWRNMVGFLLCELADNSALLATPEGCSRIEKLMMTTLLMAQPHTYSEALTAAASPTAPACVRRIEEYIAAHPGQPFSLETLSQVAGVSARSLQESFKRYRGTSPMGFVMARRLDLVRARLEQAQPQDSVTEIAMQCGFFHLGRFSQRYKAQFGETPSKTLRRAAGRSL